MKRQKQKINKAKSQFFDNISKIDKSHKTEWGKKENA